MKSIIKTGNDIAPAIKDYQECVIANNHGETVFIHKDYATFIGDFTQLEEFCGFSEIEYNQAPARVVFETIGNQYFIIVEKLNDYEEFETVLTYCANSVYEPEEGQLFFKV